MTNHASCLYDILLVLLLITVIGSPVASETLRVTYREGDVVRLYVNKLTSVSTLLHKNYYRLPFCMPVNGYRDVVSTDDAAANIGSMLVGDRISTSPYLLKMKTDVYCEKVCYAHLGRRKVRGSGANNNKVTQAIRKKYHNNWIVDNLPSAFKMEYDTHVATRYWGGFPVGFVNLFNNEAYIYNHVNIELAYHTVKTGDVQVYRIVRFTVQPLSIDHHKESDSIVLEQGTRDTANQDGQHSPTIMDITNPIASCDPTKGRVHTSYEMVTAKGRVPQLASGSALFTYDVIWKESDVQWSNRWDIYVTMDNAISHRAHWISIANSLVALIVMGSMILVVVARKIRADEDESTLENLLSEEERRDSLYDKGFALVHVSSFDPPTYRPLLLAVFCGTGAQLLGTLFIVFLAGLCGYLHPSSRGQTLIFQISAFTLNGFVNGFVTTQACHMLSVNEGWKTPAMVGARLFPGICFALLLIQSGIGYGCNSTIFVPVKFLLTLLFLWGGGLVLMTFLGAYVGHRTKPIQLPKSPRTVLLGIANYKTVFQSRDWKTIALCGVLFFPFLVVTVLGVTLLWLLRKVLVNAQCWRPSFQGIGALLLGGLFCFGVVFVEYYYMLAAMWYHYYYMTYNFLFIVSIIFFLSCSVVSVLFNYILLTVEMTHDWWFQFLCSGMSAVWLAFYAVVFFLPVLEMWEMTSVFLYCGTMVMISFAVFSMSGFVGMVSSICFVRTLFSMAQAGESMVASVADVELQGTETNDQQDIGALDDTSDIVRRPSVSELT